MSAQAFAFYQKQSTDLQPVAVRLGILVLQCAGNNRCKTPAMFKNSAQDLRFDKCLQ